MAILNLQVSLPLSSQSSRTKVSESSMQSRNTPGNLLSELYRSTNNDGVLIPFVRRQLSRTNPALSKLPHVKFGTPSLARDETTGRVVIAFRIETPTIVDAKGESMSGLMNANFLLLCELIWPIESVECQDSGLFPWTIPPQCSSANWFNPSTKTQWGFLTTGPEDARLFFDSEGALHATFGGRGCHKNTPYNDTNPVYSLYEVKWDESDDGVWTPNGMPHLLDLRTKDGRYLGNDYPPVMKSWVSIPSVHDAREKKTNHLLLGFTSSMTSSVVYEVYDTPDSVYLVKPTENSMDLKHADIGSFRGSTNLVLFRGFLLGIGHPEKRSKYFLYW